MNCLRCQTTLTFLGRGNLRDAVKWGAFGPLGEDYVRKKRLDVYGCPNCGKVELVASELDDDEQLTAAMENENRSANETPRADPPLRVAAAEVTLAETIQLDTPQQIIRPHIDDFALITPGRTVVEDVYARLGLPIATHNLANGLVLCYLSADEGNPHVVLVDEVSQIVRMVAVHNDHDHFNLDDLEVKFGLRELAALIDGHEHWLFEDNQVAFIAEGRADHAILYVQFLENGHSLGSYQAVEGYANEVFVCAGY